MMNTIEDISDAWGDALQAFLRSQDKCFHVSVDDRSREGVVATWHACMEKMPEKHLFFVLQGPALGERGWDLRADELFVQYEFLRQELARGGRVIPELGDDMRPKASAARGLTRFATILGRVEAGLSFRPSALVIVLAPIFDASRDASWTHDLRVLISGTRSLSRLRFAITELAPGPALPVVEALGGQKTAVGLESSVLRSRLVERLRAQASAPTGATGHRASGAAGPKVAPPPRPGARVTAPSPEILESADPELRLMMDPSAQETLRRTSALALACAAEGDMRGAVQAQSAVIATCEASGAKKSTLSNMLLLGVFEAALGQSSLARGVCARVRELASRSDAPELGRKALSFSAAIELASQRPLEAARFYRALATESLEVGDMLMAIEGLRACGEALIAGDRMPDAVTTFREAIDIAKTADRMQAKLSAAPTLARSLASLCQKRGLAAQAREYEMIAEELSGGSMEECR